VLGLLNTYASPQKAVAPENGETAWGGGEGSGEPEAACEDLEGWRDSCRFPAEGNGTSG